MRSIGAVVLANVETSVLRDIPGGVRDRDGAEARSLGASHAEDDRAVVDAVGRRGCDHLAGIAGEAVAVEIEVERDARDRRVARYDDVDDETVTDADDGRRGGGDVRRRQVEARVCRLEVGSSVNGTSASGVEATPSALLNELPRWTYELWKSSLTCDQSSKTGSPAAE